MASIKYQETAAGPAYTLRGTTIWFRYGLTPELLFGDSFTRIERPERFGTYDTPEARRAFVRAFVDGTVRS